VKAKALDLWYAGYRQSLKRTRNLPAPTDLFIAVCDHFEPFHDADRKEAFQRLDRWERQLSDLTSRFKDADGIPPRHTFFYPIEQYDDEVLKTITAMCERTGAEVELHFHHDQDTFENTQSMLLKGIEDFSRHGHLCTDTSGRKRYGFVHGNWALANSHPDGKGCGIIGELGLLRSTGCYADFTLPSAPERTQVRTVNSIYYAKETHLPRPHEQGERIHQGVTSPLREEQDHLLLVQGPLGLNWKRRKLFVLPRIENSDLTGANPPTLDRLALWSHLAPFVEGRPEWRFIKLHTHGALPRNSPSLIGDPAIRFHSALADRPGGAPRIHYVSAREMVNVIHAAEDNASLSIPEARDYLFKLRK